MIFILERGKKDTIYNYKNNNIIKLILLIIISIYNYRLKKRAT